MNPSHIFQLAENAYVQLSPLMGPLDASLEMVLDFEPTHGAIQLWVFNNTNRALSHKTGIKTAEQLDEFIAEVKELASVTA